jgi:serine protease AprX
LPYQKTFAALALVVWPAVAIADSSKLAKDLRDLDPAAQVDVIVQFAHPVGQHEHLRVAKRGRRLKSELAIIAAGSYTVPASSLSDLSDDPEVIYISPDRPVGGLLDYTGPTVGATYAQQNSFNGTGIGVAIIDSGITLSKDLQDSKGSSRVVYSQSFVSGVSNTTDQYGHGTHVAGIVAGNGAASTGTGFLKTFLGIAPSAKLINLRVLDGNGKGTDSAVISAIDRAIQLKNQYNIRVINLSLGRPVFESYTLDPLCQAVERAWNAGIVVVVAAGNDGRNQSQNTNGYGTINAPGNDPLVITVGAMKHMNSASRSDDLIASYSSKGPTLIDHIVKPDLVAPGNRLISLQSSKSLTANNPSTNGILYSYYETTSSKAYSADYYRLSGTSMATAVVSGAAAVLLNKDSTLSPETVKARLMKTSTKTFPSYSTAVDPSTNIQYVSQYDMFTVGAGYIDIQAALNSADFVAAGSTAASPSAVFNSGTNTVTVVNTNSSLWGTAAIWGTAAVWGSAAVWGTSVWVDGAAAVWGTSAIWGSAAVWGTSTLQGNAAVWGTAAIWGTGSTDATEALNQLVAGEN